MHSTPHYCHWQYYVSTWKPRDRPFPRQTKSFASIDEKEATHSGEFNNSSRGLPFGTHEMKLNTAASAYVRPPSVRVYKGYLLERVAVSVYADGG